MHNSQNIIRYANCWEDTDILLNALHIHAGETGISVASGGDNTFALLLADPKKIYAFDRNPAQLWLCELKMAAMRLLPYADVLRFFGVCCGDRTALYRRVRNALTKDARCYFDAQPEIIRNGLIHAGKFEHFFGIFRRRIIPLFTTRRIFGEFTAMDDPEKQLDFFEQKINRFRLHAMFRVYFGYRVMGNLGRDRSCYDYVEEKEQSGDDIRQRFAYGISHTSNAKNPYMQYIVNGNYTPRALPVYLQKRCFDLISSRLDRIQLVQSDLLNLQTEPVDFANLSDIFEYMSESEFTQNIAALSAMTAPGSRLSYWNMQNRRYLPDGDFSMDHDTSAALFRRNRSWFYRDFLLYRRK